MLLIWRCRHVAFARARRAFSHYRCRRRFRCLLRYAFFASIAADADYFRFSILPLFFDIDFSPFFLSAFIISFVSLLFSRFDAMPYFRLPLIIFSPLRLFSLRCRHTLFIIAFFRCFYDYYCFIQCHHVIISHMPLPFLFAIAAAIFHCYFRLMLSRHLRHVDHIATIFSFHFFSFSYFHCCQPYFIWRLALYAVYVTLMLRLIRCHAVCFAYCFCWYVFLLITLLLMLADALFFLLRFFITPYDAGWYDADTIRYADSANSFVFIAASLRYAAYLCLHTLTPCCRFILAPHTLFISDSYADITLLPFDTLAFSLRWYITIFRHYDVFSRRCRAPAAVAPCCFDYYAWCWYYAITPCYALRWYAAATLIFHFLLIFIDYFFAALPLLRRLHATPFRLRLPPFFFRYFTALRWCCHDAMMLCQLYALLLMPYSFYY